MAKIEPLYCDHCGVFVSPDSVLWIAELPWNITSANKGESACICYDCHEALINTP